MVTPDQRDLDHVGRIMAQWRVERPDLDVSPQGIIGRLHRLAAHLNEELAVVYSQFDLGHGEFDVLATLRRAGAPYELTPSDLAAQTMVSSGAVTKRVDRCVEHGWVTRRVGEGDARSRVVALTPAGLDLIDSAFEAHMANEQRLVSSLDELERTRLAGLLEKWGRTLGA
ncbi:MarR family winged helix-turn-helix transcriptional regulator [Nocardioides sp. T2.26MG-1]|uniref:MarR family winged helix-turn-helix transcriptional regulator n=1 Tax=Nocardioides sp. T2.26MG-1 TaxID=3041166 RepID=UPI0025421CBB|nr:MarR family transcriptional regulator [Nocardioides sp. T2.26MG-1]